MEIRHTLRKLKRWAAPGRPRTSLPNLPGENRVYTLPFRNVLVIAPWIIPLQLALIPAVSVPFGGRDPGAERFEKRMAQIEEKNKDLFSGVES